jgi:hypothetical protein
MAVSKAFTRAVAGFVLGLLLCGLLVGAAAAVMVAWGGLPAGFQAPGSPTPVATPSPNPSASLPTRDVKGDDLAALPRFPGSVRSDYEVVIDNAYRLTVTEFLAAADLDQVRAFYQGVIAAHGWERADIEFADGEWTYALVDGDTLALIEIEIANGLVEIDLQISEPIPAAPAETDAPQAPRPPPQPPDDDDDG